MRVACFEGSLLSFAPALSAVRAGKVMSVMLGVILAHTGTLAFALIQPHTSCGLRTFIIRSRSTDYRCLLLQGGQQL